MALKSILFDLYGTLIDIETDESMEEIYRVISHFLTYQEIYLHRWEVRDIYYQIMKQQKDESLEKYPEINVLKIWNTFLKQQGIRNAYPRKKLARTLAHIYRGISRKRLQIYPGVRKVLDELRSSYRLAIVTDAQACYALPEIRAIGLDGYFDPIIISNDYGFRKPDIRLIQKGLDAMRISPCDVLLVGNDMYRDIYGAKLLGIKTIFFASNQGMQSYMKIIPDFVVSGFEDVLKGVEALR